MGPAPLHRRQFIWRSAILSAYALARSVIPARARQGGESAIVVGAGLAGLAVARELQRNGRQVVVLEGRDRVGGRIWASRLWRNTAVDLGSSWISGSKNNPISRLADEFKIPAIYTSTRGISLHDPGGRAVPPHDRDRIEGNLKTLLAGIEKDRSRLSPDVSLGQALDLAAAKAGMSDEERSNLTYALESGIRLPFAADERDLSAKCQGMNARFAGEDALFPDGFDQITGGLARGLDIRLRHVVSSIAHDSGGVTVTTDQGVFRAPHACVTIPMGVLRHSGVAFSPELPSSKTTALSRLRAGALNKCCLRFRRAFWDEQSEWIGIRPEPDSPWAYFLNLYALLRKPILVGFCAGARAVAAEALSDDDTVRSAMRTLRRIYGASAPEPEGAIITRWTSDPFSRGARTFIPAGGSPDDLDALAVSVGGRLFFAGEHTSREHYGTAHGAYLSGLRAARDMHG
jgi:monoamine oxidase